MNNFFLIGHRISQWLQQWRTALVVDNPMRYNTIRSKIIPWYHHKSPYLFILGCILSLMAILPVTHGLH
jgi:hypothetical protein